jgi:hypothetical protein
VGDDSDWGWGRDFGGDMGLDFERFDVPLEATRDRLEDLIMLRVRECGVVASQRVNGVNGRSPCCLF